MTTTRRKKNVSSKRTTKVVEGVRLDKVKEELVRTAYREAAEAAGEMASPPMELPDEGSLDLEGLVSNLVMWYRAASPKEDLADCTTCGGDSDARLDACPFCGDSEVIDAGDEEVHEPEKEPEPEPEVEVQETPKGRKKKPTSTRKKKKPAAVVKVNTPPGDPEVELVDKDAHSVEELDEAVVRVDELKRAAALGIWELGQEIKKINEEKLWRLRLDEAGKGLYRTFAAFVKAELGIGYSHAHRLMSAAQAFPKEIMEKVGVAKCSILLSLPPEARAKLQEGADKKSTSQLSEEAKALRDGDRPKPPKGALTVAMAPGIIEIPMLARPKANARKASEKKAKTMADDPWAVEQLPNQVNVYYGLVKNKKGELVLRIDRRRVRKDDVFAGPEEAEE